ncbi:hypothetical protein QBC34DRAFT_19486 [Podospora aff. communis PSN243]|uniref:Altered inheritance of mitochondria protein 11 n=1 Tax=Podospora aff. communis PSN243 TaxID=3040156 RepID=A0AAV9GX25_9PEZI|nr:hypothetical protein QBC34DRAFT_19486 [Podospora aff. communis PSN243]
MPILASLLRALTGVQPDAPQPATGAPSSLSPSLPRLPDQATLQAPPPQPELPSRPYTPILCRRSFRQLGLYFGGCTFLAFSILISRRASLRHQLKARLRYFTPSTHHLNFKKGQASAAAEEGGKEPLLALEALNLATLNVVSFAVMMAGGVSWALDVSNMEDLRWWARRSLTGVHGKLDEQSEKELAEWVANTLGMKLEEEGEAKTGGAEKTEGKGEKP